MRLSRHLALQLILTLLGTGCTSTPETRTSSVISDLGNKVTLTNVNLDRRIYALAGGGDAVWVGPDFGTWLPGSNILRIDPLTSRIAATIPISVWYTVMTMAVGEDSVWAPGDGLGSLQPKLFRIDARRNEIVASVPLDGYSEGIAVGEGAVWVGSGTTLSKIDPQTNTVVAEIPIGRDTWDRIAAGEGSVWMLKMSDGIVYRIDPRDNKIIAQIRVGSSFQQQFGLALGPEAMSTPLGPLGGVVPWHSLAEKLWVSQMATWLPYKSIAAGEGAVWVTEGGGHAPGLLRIDPQTNTVLVRIHLPEEPESVTTYAGYVWVSTRSTLVKVDPDTNHMEDVFTLPSGSECPHAHSIATAGAGSLWLLQTSSPNLSAGACLWRVAFDQK